MGQALTAALTGKVNQSELAAYQKKSEAFSGQYSDLAGKPSTFPPAAHTHTIANVTDLQATVNKAHEHANKAALDKISETGGKLAYGGTAVGGVSSWTELADKPSTFPPAAHSHTIANVTDLQTMLNSKAASAHGHAVADVTGLQSLLDGKAAVGHTHAAADVTGLATALAGKVSSVNGLTPDDSGALVLPQATSGAAGLMAAADKVKLNKFNGYGVPAKRIITTTDLDTLKEPGAYALYGNAVYSNIPEGETAGWLFVEATEAGAEQIRQEFVPMVVNLERRYVRRYNTNTNIWTDWVHNYFAMSARDPIDFNQLTDVGVYFINGSAEHMNYPGTYATIGGILTVQGIGAYRTQSFAALSSPNQSVTWTRWATSDGSSWLFQNWRKHLIDLDITESKTSPGYFKLPGGMIVQWGKKTAITQDEENCYISFPIAFPTMFLSATAIASSGTLSATGVIVSLSEASTTSMTMVVKNHPNTGSPDMDQYIEMYWFAVGF